MKNIKKYGLMMIIILFLLPVGCTKKDFLTEDPKTLLVAENLYTNTTGFEYAVNGLYALVRELRTEDYGWLTQNPMVLGTDDVFVNYGDGNNTAYAHWGFEFTPTAAINSVIYSWVYKIINSTNTLLDRSENQNVKWTEADKMRITAEARLIRAWAYRIATFSWGDIPISTHENTGVKTDWVRSPQSEVFKLMEEDLMYAETNLPATSTNPGKLVNAVASHYLSELYLAMNKPDKAEAEALKVINSGLYSLNTARYGVKASQPGCAFMDQFYDGNSLRTQGNKEVLWAFLCQENVATEKGLRMRRFWVNRYNSISGVAISAEYGGRGIGRNGITRHVLDLYEPQDDRGSAYAIRKFYVASTGAHKGDTIWCSKGIEKENDMYWPSTRKWDWVSADPAKIQENVTYNDQVYLRLAETYLLLAEAQFKQGKLAEATNILNIVRRRSHASDISASNVTFDFILDERSRELITEEDRRFTLVRTGKWFERTKLYNKLTGPLIKETNNLYPIPQNVIDANLDAVMPQNPGY